MNAVTANPWKSSVLRTAAVLLAAALLWAFWGADAWHERDVSALASGTTAKAPQAQVQEGAYLARIGNCAVCHTAQGGEPFAGGREIDTPFGAVPSSNLTPDPEHGIGQWSADDFWRAMHFGKGRDGHRLSPAFPYTSYTHVSRADSDALLAYLQSLPPSRRANVPSKLMWPFNTQAALAVWRALYFWPASNATKESSASVPPDTQRGAYLVQGLGHCAECHGARSPLGGLHTGKEFAGAVLPGTPWYAPSLLNAAEAGATSVDDAVRLLQTGTTGLQSANSQGVAQGPMAEVVLHGSQYLRDDDARSMALYLQTLVQAAPVQSQAPAADAAQAKTDSRAAKLYEDHCAACHGKEGQGQPGAYPALAGNRAVLMARPNNAVLSVQFGGFAPATAGNPRPYGMPPFLLTLNDGDVAAVLSHLRSSWGNHAAGVTELEVQQIRRLQAAH
jgi:mono/diheme cytochrome c family protein